MKLRVNFAFFFFKEQQLRRLWLSHLHIQPVTPHTLRSGMHVKEIESETAVLHESYFLLQWHSWTCSVWRFCALHSSELCKGHQHVPFVSRGRTVSDDPACKTCHTCLLVSGEFLGRIVFPAPACFSTLKKIVCRCIRINSAAPPDWWRR